MGGVERTGGCLCGAVRYRVRGEPVHVGCCDCRKESGGAWLPPVEGASQHDENR